MGTNESYDGPERRASAKDHDEIVKLNTNMKMLCRMLGDLQTDIKEQKAICSCRMKDCNAFFVQSRVFYTALAIIVMILGGLGTVAYETRTELVEHRGVTLERQKQIDHNFDELENKLTQPFIFPSSNGDESN